MKYLVDTHTLLWYVDGDSRLPTQRRDDITNSDNEIYISHVSIWEIGIKISTGKLSLSKNLATYIEENIDNYFDLLHININHILQATSLPLYHRDPFDRLLIAQSRVENIPIISSDIMFDKYEIIRSW